MASGESKQNARDQSKGFLALFFIGFFIILAGIIFLIVATLSSEGSISFGGFVLIGPFPIVFGGGPGAPWLVLFAIILGVLSLIMFFIIRKKLKALSRRCLPYLMPLMHLQNLVKGVHPFAMFLSTSEGKAKAAFLVLRVFRRLEVTR